MDPIESRPRRDLLMSGAPRTQSVLEQRFSTALRQTREQRGWSQADLAREARQAGLRNFHPTTVSRIEANERSVRLNEADLLAGLFDVTLPELLQPSTPFSAASRTAARITEWEAAVSTLRAAHEGFLQADAVLTISVASLQEWLDRSTPPVTPNERAEADLVLHRARAALAADVTALLSVRASTTPRDRSEA